MSAKELSGIRRSTMTGRFLCIDFETNGFSERSAKREDWTLPCQNYPTQVSVDIVEYGEITHAYDTLITGATSLSAWAKANTPISLAILHEHGRPLMTVLDDVAGLLQEGDTLVAHNISFDLDQALARTARKLGFLQYPSLQKILHTPRFCTRQCAYSRNLFGQRCNLEVLCKHFNISYSRNTAHDATYDTNVLAQCVAEAWRRGVML